MLFHCSLTDMSRKQYGSGQNLPAMGFCMLNSFPGLLLFWKAANIISKHVFLCVNKLLGGSMIDLLCHIVFTADTSQKEYSQNLPIDGFSLLYSLPAMPANF